MNARDEGQQWVLKPDRWRHSSAFLKSPTGATYRLPEDTARDLHGALNALQQQVTELDGRLKEQAATFLAMQATSEATWRAEVTELEAKAALADAVLGVNDAIKAYYDALISPSTIAQEEQR